MFSAASAVRSLRDCANLVTDPLLRDISPIPPLQVHLNTGSSKSRTEAITTWSANGKSGIAFGGARYEVKALPASAPACKGNATCVRLATVPDGKSDATRTLYLTR
jgi:hypothetical protein